MVKKMYDYLQLLRIHQWLKNLFIFIPLFFDRHLFDVDYLYNAFIAFIAFCLAASSIYCFNDIWDIKADKLHPQKCKRPIAKGTVKISTGYLIMLLLLGLSIFTLFLFEKENKIELIGIIGFYYLMNILYCIKLKQIAILDVFIIAIGFVLRILIGGIATNITLSHWIILMTFLLALFLAFAKRRDDVVINLETGINVRKNVNRYNLEFLNQALTIISSITMVSYIMYTVSDDVIARFGSNYLYLTSVWVLAGIIRYLQLTIVDAKSGSPTKILMKDHFIQICLIGWMAHFVILIYF